MSGSSGHSYEVRVNSGDGPTGTLSASPRPSIEGGPPPQFGGGDGWWSPEHLLLGAAGLCLMATFKALAARGRVTVASYDSRVEGSLEKTGSGFAFTSVRIRAEVSVAAEDVEKAERLIQLAKKNCIVANSLKAAVSLDAKVEAARTAPLCPPEAGRRSLS